MDIYSQEEEEEKKSFPERLVPGRALFMVLPQLWAINLELRH